MKASLPFRLPRLYVFLLVMVVLFTLLNIAILVWGKNLFLWFEAIWAWAWILFVALMGAMLIGMFISYRLLAFREFTPFEREMMEMRVEVGEIKEALAEMREDASSPGTAPAADAEEAKEGEVDKGSGGPG